MSELWKEIPGVPNYEASSLGRIRSLDRYVPCRPNGKVDSIRLHKGRILKLIKLSDGHLQVNLSHGPKVKAWPAHHLIALAFLGPRPLGYVIDHLNCVKDDNRPENLEWVEPEENVRRAHANLIMPSTREHRVKMMNEMGAA